MKKIFSIIALTVFCGTSAHASFLIDPYLSYMTSGSSSISSTSSITGNELGTRLGWEFLGFGLGLDALISGKYTYSTAGTNTDVTPSYMGVFASYSFPILVRGYISYLVNAKETMSAGDYYSGTGTKIGVQYTGLPFVAIGLESYSGSYNNYTSAAGVSSTRSDTASHTNLTISLPLSF